MEPITCTLDWEEPEISVNLTKDSYGFQQVLDDFPNASLVFISSFRTVYKSGDLLHHLRQLKSGTQVILVTGVPSRAEWKQLYLDKLWPLNFTAEIEIYWCPDNHSKIVATQSMAYIGSANFTAPSKDNYECGVLIKGEDAVAATLFPIIDFFKQNCERYYGGEVSRLIIELRWLVGWYRYLHQSLDKYAACRARVSPEDEDIRAARGSIPSNFVELFQDVCDEASHRLDDWEMSGATWLTAAIAVKRQTVDKLAELQHTQQDITELASLDPWSEDLPPEEPMTDEEHKLLTLNSLDSIMQTRTVLENLTTETNNMISLLKATDEYKTEARLPN